VLIQSGTSFPAEVQVVDYGMGPGAGPVATMGAAPGTWSRAAGWKEILLIFAPIVAAIALQAPDGIVLLSFVVAVVIAALGAARRRRLARRARH
jgi:hypothetical protein